jgi:hypothetical protein
MLENTWCEIEYRLDILRATNGAHIEMYDELFLQAEQTSFLCLIYCVLCVLEMWSINYDHYVS